MPEIVFAIPTINPARCTATFKKWRDAGYATAAMIEPHIEAPGHCDYVLRPTEYRGWAWATNQLCRFLTNGFESDAHWIIAGGDDQYPDPTHDPQRIAAECEARFAGTFGIMQPAGDAYGALADKSAAVCPWIGREWIRRSYGGQGPLWEAYGHYYADTDLAAVATQCNAIWWRDDVNQYHDHYLRHGQPTPQHLKKWQPSVAPAKALFESRRAQRFPGSEPLPA